MASNLVRVRAVVKNVRHNMSYGRGRNFHHGDTLPDALGKGGTAILARIRVWRLRNIGGVRERSPSDLNAERAGAATNSPSPSHQCRP